MLDSSVTFSDRKHHMNEVVEVTFQDDTAPQRVVLNKEIKTLSPSAKPLNSFYPCHKHHINEQLTSETIVNFYTSDQLSESEF